MHNVRQLILWAFLAAATSAQAQAPVDLVGARGSSGETQLQARGYRLIRASQANRQSWKFWCSDFQRQCVSIATAEGRYAASKGAIAIDGLGDFRGHCEAGNWGAGRRF